METAQSVRCSFCLRWADEVDKIIDGPGTFICAGCVRACVAILEADDGSSTSLPSWHGMDDEALLARLPRIAEAADQVEQSLAQWVEEARRRGVSWARVGTALGMTRQSAWKRFSAE